ncbi:hypothetical protein [Acaryochloris sp. IP29b_bin.137]|uniref:hypothetical protein n=1 Tax=Acaryochloris sp. IP29b_bin.137 TaxID=2969217 RepID=UPI002631B644|nr:hypothetical protein [Acaryochloris sp. IP29b_bin.137]
MLAPLPVNAPIPESEAFRDTLSTLEYFIPEVLREVYDEWKYESLDGVLTGLALKTNDYAAEIAGLGIILSDQTYTPLYVRLKLLPDKDEVAWFDCNLGEVNPRGRSKKMDTMAVVDRLNRIEWSYHAGFG